MPVLQFDTKLSIWQCFHYLAVQFDDFFGSRHKLQEVIIQEKPVPVNPYKKNARNAM